MWLYTHVYLYYSSSPCVRILPPIIIISRVCHAVSRIITMPGRPRISRDRVSHTHTRFGCRLAMHILFHTVVHTYVRLLFTLKYKQAQTQSISKHDSSIACVRNIWFNVFDPDHKVLVAPIIPIYNYTLKIAYRISTVHRIFCLYDEKF